MNFKSRNKHKTRLSTYLDRNDISQAEFAQLLSKETGRPVDAAMVSRWVNGICTPSLAWRHIIDELTHEAVAERDWFDDA